MGDRQDSAAAAAAAKEEETRKFRAYYDAAEAMNSPINDASYAFSSFERKAASEEESREAVKRYFDLLEARIKLIADFFGGTVTRLAEVPKELEVDPEVGPFLRPDMELARHPKLKNEDQPFLKMDVKGRTYLFFLPNSGVVNVYVQGEYKGGNHDLAFYEIFSHLKDGDWFGINGP